jgi:hypothetical protein
MQSAPLGKAALGCAPCTPAKPLRLHGEVASVAPTLVRARDLQQLSVIMDWWRDVPRSSEP